MYPYPSEGCDSYRPRRPRSENRPPRHRHALIGPVHLVPNASLNISQLLLGYPRMRSRRIEGEEIPEKAPEDSNTAGRVEDHSPAEMGDDEPAQWIGQPDAEAEP